MSQTTGAVEPFRYDTYVSYAEADRDWVEERLVPRLEAAGRRVCLEHDLPPGGVELEERSRAVAESRKTLVVVSGAYLENRWSLLEEAVTAELDPAARKRRLIPVLHGDGELPLRIRPLVAVDLRRDEEPRQWQRLLDAVDPTRVEEPAGFVQRWSLLLSEATGELVRPSWNGAGAVWLGAGYLALVAAIALLYLLLWEVPALRDPLTLLLSASAHVVGALVWREDRDLFRRLSHLLARSRGARAGVAAWTVAATAAWGVVGVPEARELLCGPFGCKEKGKIHLVIDEFDPGGVPEVAGWAPGLHHTLAQKLQAVPQIEVFGIDLPQIDGAARRRLKVDYTVTGRFEPRQVTAALWNRHHRPVPPMVTVPSSASGGARQLAVQNELADSLLERLGVEVPAELTARLARIPTDDPRAAELNAEGFRLLREERYDEAFAELREAVELDDDYSVAWSNLGEVAWRVGRYDEALEYRRAAVERLPSYAPFHYNLGHLLAELGQDEEAMPSLRRAVELDPAHTRAYNEMGKVLTRLGEPERAAEELRKGLLLDPDFAAAWKNLGRARLAAGNAGDAVDALEKSLGLYPPADVLGRSEAHSLLVAAQVRRGEGTAACRSLDTLRELDPDGFFPFTPAAEEAAGGLPCAGTNPEEDTHA